MDETLIERLRKRAEIRRQIPNRKSVQNNETDRIADLLEEAADALEPRELSDEEMLNSWEGIDPSEECWISDEQLKQFARAILKKASEK